ncbi:hypothetical protein CONPUDRAFT_60263, partial [Coniophora puteana RWD-64-598 SS2]
MDSVRNTWAIAPISQPRLRWGEVRAGHRHACPHCGIDLLTGESPGFCCGPRGSRLNQVRPLPPLPPEYDVLLQDNRISTMSRILNLVFSFAAMETTHSFPHNDGPRGFLAIQGRVYHR